MNLRELFLQHVAQTSPAPLALEIIKAEGSILTDSAGKQYLDLIGGINVAATGHRHPRVIAAIQKQLEAYLHIMVYGEMVESPQVNYARTLAEKLPPSLNSVYFTNSGAEAVEGAMKLSKRVTGRVNMLAFNNSYHGSTQGALSLIGSEYWRNAFRPLLPGVSHQDFNSFEAIDLIDEKMACVVVEPVQAEAGIISASAEWLRALRAKCNETGTMLVFDEIQTGFGRTGTLWAFEKFDVVPDILLAGKALGGGLPLGAFIADRKLMNTLTADPVLGHITTFGGHPLSCAAGLASLQVIIEDGLMESVEEKSRIFLEQLDHRHVKSIRKSGFWLALEFDSFETNKKVIDSCIDEGLLTDWFLFAPECLRISPPLTMSTSEIKKAAGIIQAAMEKL